jgi:tetratricopeptide (TPR) repeat protein
MHLKDYDAAVADNTKAIELEPTADMYRDHVQFRAICPDPAYRDPPAMLELARKAVELAPDKGDAWAVLGMAQVRAGEAESALQSMRKAQELGATDDEYLLLFGALIHAQLGQLEEGRRSYDQAVQYLVDNDKADKDHFTGSLKAEVETLLRAAPIAADSAASADTTNDEQPTSTQED